MRSGVGRLFGWLLVLCMAVAALWAPLSDFLGIYVTRIEIERFNARAAAMQAESSLVVARGEGAILAEAARAVASDRRLVTFYALSGNAAVLLGVFLGGIVAGGIVAGGVVAGVLFGRARKNGGDGNV